MQLSSLSHFQVLLGLKLDKNKQQKDNRDYMKSGQNILLISAYKICHGLDVSTVIEQCMSDWFSLTQPAYWHF